MAKSNEQYQAVSMRPDDMVNAGLADDFDGEITSMRFIARTYPSGDMEGKYFLAVEVKIQGAEDSGYEEVVEVLNAGDLRNFVPSLDGRSIAGGTAEDYRILAEGGEPDDIDSMSGPYCVYVGSKKQGVGLPNNSKWAQWVVAAVKAGFPEDRITDRCDFAVGVQGHFDRVDYDQKGRGGKLGSADGKRGPQLLVLSEVKHVPAAGAGAAGTGAAAKAKTTTGTTKKANAAGSTPAESAGTSSSDDDFSPTLDAFIVEKIMSNGNTMPLTDLRTAVVARFQKKEMTKALRLFNDPNYYTHADRPWTFDEDSNTLSVA